MSVEGITAWSLPDAAPYPGDRYAWLLRGPNGGIVACPNRKGGFGGRVAWRHAPLPDEEALPEWLARVVCWVLGAPGAERPAPEEWTAASLAIVKLRAAAEAAPEPRRSAEIDPVMLDEYRAEMAERRRQREEAGLGVDR